MAKSKGIETDIFGYPKAKSVLVNEREKDVFGYPVSKGVLATKFVKESRAEMAEDIDPLYNDTIKALEKY